METNTLKKKLQDLKEELEDLEEERFFMLEKTSIHVPGSARKIYEREIKSLKEEIYRIEEKLASKDK